MQCSRRELMRFFSIGATITPVIGGAPLIEQSAKLLAEPSIEPVIVDKFPDGHVGEHWQVRVGWNPFEKIWLEFWQIENNPPGYLNSGIGPLESVLKREPTAAEKAAVAAVIQWFGSNCGHAFIEETLRAQGYLITIDEARFRSIAANNAAAIVIRRRDRNVLISPWSSGTE